MSEPCPRARPLDPIPAEVQGQQVIVLRDPLRFSEEVVVPPVLYFFLAHCDGQKTLSDIKLAFARQFQHILTEQETNGILEELDRHYLLDTERFRCHREEVVRAYRDERTRRAAHQGSAYSGSPESLRSELDSYYAFPEGPGTPPSAIARGNRQLAGLIAPHIGVRQGGSCFAWAYGRICESLPIETFVILGTGHAEIPGCFAATRKTFETPLGPVPVDTDFLDRLGAHYGSDLCAEEIHHRAEHVIEFQLIFLQHALADRGDFRIVPILCSYQPESLADGAETGETAAIVDRFCEALRRTAAETPRAACVICSADLAHIGWRYGDPVHLGPADLDRLEREDRAMLDIVCSGSAEGFFENLVREGNRRRVCGFPCIYAMVRALDLKNGELLRYGQSAMDERNSTVSYASVAFYGPSAGADKGGGH